MENRPLGKNRPLSRNVAVVLAFAAVAALSTIAFAAAASAQDQRTPKGWSYEIKNGQRVPKSSRATNADGSWREELRQGNCVTIKEKSAAGEYKETRQCDPK